jgi:seryl-tRNA synthetase
MPGLVPGIHVFYRPCNQDVDGRDKPGHDGKLAMHDIRAIRENPTNFDAGLKRRGLAPLADHLMSIDERRRAIIRVLEGHKATRNQLSAAIGAAKKLKNAEIEADLLGKVTLAKISISNLEGEQTAADAELRDALAAIPNLPLDEVPDGTDEHGNVQHHVFGKIRNYGFAAKPHDDLGGALGYMDFEAAAKLSGARFVVLKKGLARLERAIGQFMLDLHTNEHGYAEINPPLLVRDAVMFGTGQLPKFEDDQFFVSRPTEIDDAKSVEVVECLAQFSSAKAKKEKFQDQLDTGATQNRRDITVEIAALNVQMGRLTDHLRKLFNAERLGLIPTAEVPLTNLVRESILDEKELPMRLTALTPCFRAEAGAAGRDTRGMIRQHQFTKVELVSITTPENSKDEHERMLACAEEVLRQLDLHYRVMTLCAGDMGFSAQKTYDIEVWMPGQGEGGAYREISSCSVCGDFQARRMDARYRGPDGKPRFVHTLNGSGTAVGRALIAVMETYQQQDGSIAVPDVLQPYMGGLKVIEHDK